MILSGGLLAPATGKCRSRLGHAMKLHLEPHVTKRSDLVRHARLDQARCNCGIKDTLRRRVEHPVQQPALPHMDQPPGAGRGAVRTEQPGRDRRLGEHGRAAVGFAATRQRRGGLSGTGVAHRSTSLAKDLEDDGIVELRVHQLERRAARPRTTASRPPAGCPSAPPVPRREVTASPGAEHWLVNRASGLFPIAGCAPARRLVTAKPVRSCRKRPAT